MASFLKANPSWHLPLVTGSKQTLSYWSWNQPWVFTGRTDAEAEAPILWPPYAKSQLTGKDSWCWKRLKAEGDDRGWDGWVASPTWWTWVWASSGSWWKAGKPGVLHSMGSQRVRHYWAIELNWISNLLFRIKDLGLHGREYCLSSPIRITNVQV